jgi:hypothetical protein
MEKVILKDSRPTKEIELPSYKGSKVVVYPSLLVGDAMMTAKPTDEVQFGMESLTKLIKSWNFVDEKQVDLPITLDNLKILNISDLEYLMKQVTEFALEVKKN